MRVSLPDINGGTFTSGWVRMGDLIAELGGNVIYLTRSGSVMECLPGAGFSVRQLPEAPSHISYLASVGGSLLLWGHKGVWWYKPTGPGRLIPLEGEAGVPAENVLPIERGVVVMSASGAARWHPVPTGQDDRAYSLLDAQVRIRQIMPLGRGAVLVQDATHAWWFCPPECLRPVKVGSLDDLVPGDRFGEGVGGVVFSSGKYPRKWLRETDPTLAVDYVDVLDQTFASRVDGGLVILPAFGGTLLLAQDPHGKPWKAVIRDLKARITTAQFAPAYIRATGTVVDVGRFTDLDTAATVVELLSANGKRVDSKVCFGRSIDCSLFTKEPGTYRVRATVESLAGCASMATYTTPLRVPSNPVLNALWLAAQVVGLGGIGWAALTVALIGLSRYSRWCLRLVTNPAIQKTSLFYRLLFSHVRCVRLWVLSVDYRRRKSESPAQPPFVEPDVETGAGGKCKAVEGLLNELSRSGDRPKRIWLTGRAGTGLDDGSGGA